MKVGIAGAGAIAMGYAAFLLSRGHIAYVWSPSGARTTGLRAGEPLTVSGAIEGAFHPKVCKDASELACAEVILVALPANGHRSVIDALAPHIEPRHVVIFSGHLSFAALYLARSLAKRGVEIPIVVWNTTALTCKANAHNEVRVGALRKMVSIAVTPSEAAGYGRDVCIDLFGERFSLQADILTVTLSNLNPQSHLAVALLNLTRLERGETWGQRENMTSTVGRLIEALDKERLALAAAFGKEVSTVFDHYRDSFGLTGQSVADLSAQQVENGSDVAGPKTLDSRYVLEDVPFGLIPILRLAELAGIEVPLHSSGINILSAAYGRDFASENDLLPGIQIDDIKDMTG